MGMGIPHVCNAGVGDVDDIVSHNGVGVSIKEFSDIEYNRAIDVMLKNTEPNTWAIMRAAEEVYSLKSGVNLYAKVYQYLHKQ